jgi:hypothetical protein
MSDEWGPKVSVFWTDRQFGVGRFPPLDRLDYLDRPVVLAERERVAPAPPGLEEIRDYLRGAPFANWTKRAHEFAGAGALDAKDRKAYLRALLYPARLCFSYATGLMTSNDDAVAYLARTNPARPRPHADRTGAAMPPSRRRSRFFVRSAQPHARTGRRLRGVHDRSKCLSMKGRDRLSGEMVRL